MFSLLAFVVRIRMATFVSCETIFSNQPFRRIGPKDPDRHRNPVVSVRSTRVNQASFKGIVAWVLVVELEDVENVMDLPSIVFGSAMNYQHGWSD